MDWFSSAVVGTGVIVSAQRATGFQSIRFTKVKIEKAKRWSAELLADALGNHLSRGQVRLVA